MTGALRTGRFGRETPLVFSLLDSPFALLGATTRTPIAELPALADRVGTPEAAAAARTLSLPRTRLPMELAFLPGSHPVAPGVLDALRAGRPPPMDGLTTAARANVLAHRCAAGIATAAELQALVAGQRAPGDAGLLADIDADRAAAGLPRVQPALLGAEQDALAEQHAACVLAACRGAADPAAALAALVREAPAGPPASLMRRVTAGWSRQAASAVTRLDEAASTAEAALARTPGAATAAPFADAIRAWAAATLPQRLSDARAGLDHAPTLRAVRGWRAALQRLSGAGHPELSASLAQVLADQFADLPGETRQFAEDVRSFAGKVEEQVLEAALVPLRAVADRLAAAPAALDRALARGPFGPAANGAAGELWAAFDAAATACVASEAPWTVVRNLAQQIGGEHRVEGAAVALALHRGMLARAEQAGFGGLSARLRMGLRGLERAALLHRYQLLAGTLHRRRAPVDSPLLSWKALEALKRVLPLVDDPGLRTKLDLDAGVLRRSFRRALAVILIPTLVLGLIGLGNLDDYNAEHARYRAAQPQSLTRDGVPDRFPDAPAPAPGPPYDPFPKQDKGPQPRMAFPARSNFGERMPRNDGQPRTLAEVRWCVFNEARLNYAETAATPDQRTGVTTLRTVWTTLCTHTVPNASLRQQVNTELVQHATQLMTEGVQMLSPDQ